MSAAGETAQMPVGWGARTAAPELYCAETYWDSTSQAPNAENAPEGPKALPGGQIRGCSAVLHA